jgi:hypothetical protein
VLQHTQLHAALLALLLLGAALIGQDSVLIIAFQVLFEVLTPQSACSSLPVTHHPCGTLGVGLLFRDPVDLADQIPEGFLNILGSHGTRLNICDLYIMLKLSGLQFCSQN